MTWLIIHTPTGVHCWNLGDPTPDERADLFNAARVATGFPPNDVWVADGSGYDIQETQGEPHPTLLDKATVGTLADLSKVDPAAVQAHADARAQAAKAGLTDDAKRMLASLPADVLQAVLADPAVAARTSMPIAGGLT